MYSPYFIFFFSELMLIKWWDCFQKHTSSFSSKILTYVPKTLHYCSPDVIAQGKKNTCLHLVSLKKLKIRIPGSSISQNVVLKSRGKDQECTVCVYQHFSCLPTPNRESQGSSCLIALLSNWGAWRQDFIAMLLATEGKEISEAVYCFPHLDFTSLDMGSVSEILMKRSAALSSSIVVMISLMHIKTRYFDWAVC